MNFLMTRILKFSTGSSDFGPWAQIKNFERRLSCQKADFQENLGAHSKMAICKSFTSKWSDEVRLFVIFVQSICCLFFYGKRRCTYYIKADPKSNMADLKL